MSGDDINRNFPFGFASLEDLTRLIDIFWKAETVKGGGVSGAVL